MLEKYIEDDEQRRYMMPDYELGTRRVIPTNSYLPALSRENVDVEFHGIERITPSGIRTRNGKDIPLDIIVYATGYFAYSDPERLLPFRVRGVDGRFPNYFKINGPNTGTGHSSQISYMEAMVHYTVKAISAVKGDETIKAIDVKREVQSRYVAKMKEAMKSTVWQRGECKAFYRRDMTGEVTSLSPESVVHFIFSRKRFHLEDYHLIR